MPRDFEPAIGEELGVYLYGIDDLSEACERNREARADALPAAERIIDEETRAFVAETRHRAAGPVIARFREGLETVQTRRAGAALRPAARAGRARAARNRQFADRLVAKMLHPPLESLRDESRNGSPHGLLEALQRLFQLKDKAQ